MEETAPQCSGPLSTVEGVRQVNEALITTARPGRLAGRLAAGLLLILLVLASLPVPSASAATAAPGGLRSTAVTPTTTSLAWSAVAGAPMYRVKYSTSASMT